MYNLGSNLNGAQNAQAIYWQSRAREALWKTRSNLKWLHRLSKRRAAGRDIAVRIFCKSMTQSSSGPGYSGGSDAGGWLRSGCLPRKESLNLVSQGKRNPYPARTVGELGMKHAHRTIPPRQRFLDTGVGSQIGRRKEVTPEAVDL